MSDSALEDNHYSKTAKWLHWLMAVVLLFDLTVAQGLSSIPSDQKAGILVIHSSIGSTLLILVLFRLFWRYRNPAPTMPMTTAHWQLLASKASHYLLYMLMIVVPVTGYYIANASPIAVMPFGAIALGGEGMTEEAFLAVRSLHELATEALILLIAIHFLAALNHRLIQKDGVFQRMFPRFGRRS